MPTDDPFLPKECYPYKIANQKSNIYLQTPKFGGHVGFMTNFRFEKMLWHERQIVDFFRKYI
jgi:predicted alpha/beta-fold hydrolase